MKRIIAVLLTLILILSVSACSSGSISNEDEGTAQSSENKSGTTDDPTAALSGNTMKNKDDETNVYLFYADGTYKETYKGSDLEGTWEVLEDERVCLTYNESTKYYYNIDRDENNNVTGLSQYEGRTFIFA